MDKKKLGGRFWGTIALVGFIGQLAWAIENNYINLWVFSQTGNSDAITYMTIFSALVATVTTFLMGTLSDRIGKRKIFISVGFIIWGITVFSFGLISKENMANLFGESNAILMVGIWMVVIDCFMTFFGSTASDACFNAMVTDMTDSSNRGKVTSFLSTLPLFANALMMVIGMPLHVAATPDDYLKDQIAAGVFPNGESALAHGWLIYFIICGALVTVSGIVSLFLIPKDKCVANRDESYLKNLAYAFRKDVIKKNKLLYIAFLVFFCFNSAINAFMPYYMIYLQLDPSVGGLGFLGLDFYLTIAVIFGISCLLAILNGIFILDRFDKIKQLYVSLGITAVGLLGIALSRNMALVMVFGSFMITGYLVMTSILGAITRNLTPKKEVGLFEGVRMVFCVLLPMITGPLISSALFPTTSYVDETNFALNGKTPSNVMFFVALGFIILSVVPVVWLHIAAKKEKNNENQESDACNP